jgi:hypothetical protein
VCYIIYAPFDKHSYRKCAKTVTNLFIMNLNGVKSEAASVLEMRYAVCQHKSHVTTKLIKFGCVLTKGRATMCWFVRKNGLQFVILTSDFLVLATGICRYECDSGLDVS